MYSRCLKAIDKEVIETFLFDDGREILSQYFSNAKHGPLKFWYMEKLWECNSSTRELWNQTDLSAYIRSFTH